MRGERLGSQGGGLFLLAETSLERIHYQAEELKPSALVVDSVQTVFSAKFPSAPGSISQLPEVASLFLFVPMRRGSTGSLLVARRAGPSGDGGPACARSRGRGWWGRSRRRSWGCPRLPPPSSGPGRSPPTPCSSARSGSRAR